MREHKGPNHDCQQMYIALFMLHAQALCSCLGATYSALGLAVNWWWAIYTYTGRSCTDSCIQLLQRNESEHSLKSVAAPLELIKYLTVLVQDLKVAW